jgi:cold shock CspA family protein
MSLPNEPPAPDATNLIGKFYRGTVLKVSSGAERGTIRSASGRNIVFLFQHVTLIGPHQSFADLQEGLEVGFDVSWTSKGLRVSVIRIPD